MSHREERQADRARLLARLQNLRTIVPVFAEELASARRQAARLRAARLRLENGRLVEQVRRLQHERIGRGRARGDNLLSKATPNAMSVHANKGVGDAQHAHTVARLG